MDVEVREADGWVLIRGKLVAKRISDLGWETTKVGRASGPFPEVA